MNINLYVIEDYKNETAFRPKKNKPNSNPISSKAKMNLKSLAGKSGHTRLIADVKKLAKCRAMKIMGAMEPKQKQRTENREQKTESDFRLLISDF